MKVNQKRHPSLEAIFFDLDGTLVDTEQTALQTLRYFFPDLSLETLASSIVGKTWKSALQEILTHHGHLTSFADLYQTITQHYEAQIKHHLIPVPGSLSFIPSLASTFRLGIVSGSNRSHILFILKQLHLTHYFETILGAEDYLHSKPAPDGYLQALETFQLTPERCLVFEDSHAGIQAARKANLLVIAITQTNHTFQDQSQAHSQIKNFETMTKESLMELYIRLYREGMPQR